MLEPSNSTRGILGFSRRSPTPLKIIPSVLKSLHYAPLLRDKPDPLFFIQELPATMRNIRYLWEGEDLIS